MSKQTAFVVERLSSLHLEVPLAEPRRNAFGTQKTRAALCVCLHFDDGTIGWGEVFCNWPPGAAAHRSNLLRNVMRPLVERRLFDSPAEMVQRLETATHLLALQSGEPGPFSQVIAGLDVAAWDAVARRADQPLWSVLSDREAPAEVPAYASALTGRNLDKILPGLVADGWCGFKLKVGFDPSDDVANLRRLRSLVGPNAAIMADANQVWDISSARDLLPRFAAEGVTWLEEPIAADSPADHWSELAGFGLVPLAAGENQRGVADFDSIATAGVRVLQPDIIKWGGLSGAMQVAHLAQRHGVTFAPHYLGGGIGLAATAHLAAATNAMWLEYDVTENPLRDQLLGDALSVRDGHVLLHDNLGHGATPDLDALAKHVVNFA